jgi:hypothetical protein
MERTELKAPTGKFRVVGVDLFDHGDYLVGDYDTTEEAFRIADDHNKARKGSMDDVYYVYNDQRKFLRNPAGNFGVSP